MYYSFFSNYSETRNIVECRKRGATEQGLPGYRFDSGSGVDLLDSFLYPEGFIPDPEMTFEIITDLFKKV
jgi:hypothetical protein